MDTFRSHEVTPADFAKDFPQLRELFEKNINPDKTMKLETDLDEHNNPVELKEKGYEVLWTELKDPNSGEVIEAKVYLPKGQKVDKVLIMSPGYKGDFVLQEGLYAEDLVKEGRAFVVLRHQYERAQGEDMKNYVHADPGAERAHSSENRYMGDDGGQFDFSKASREVLVALKALNIDNLERVDVLGHSWGARNAVLSAKYLEEEAHRGFSKSERIAEKLKTLTIVGAWLETDPEKLKAFDKLFAEQVKADYFKGMTLENVQQGMRTTSEKLKTIREGTLPQHTRVVAIQGLADTDVNFGSELAPFFKQLGKHTKGVFALKDFALGFARGKHGEQIKEGEELWEEALNAGLQSLDNPQPLSAADEQKLREDFAVQSKLGGRKGEQHDYYLGVVRRMVKMIID